MPYTAKVTRGPNRKYFSVDFRHPVKKDRAGRFGLKVRRGLGTTDADEAERLVSELNQLLADEAFHRPTARAAAQEKGFSEVVIDLFFRDVEPIAVDRSLDRDRLVRLPTSEDGYATVLLLGTTGSGKTTLVRQFMGTDPAIEKFPSTAPGRTTVADQEFILRPSGNYEAVVTFMPRDLIVARVEDALADSALIHLQGRKRSAVEREFLAPRGGRFRLSYILGSAPSNPKDSDADLDDGAEDDLDAFDTRAASTHVSRVAEFVDRLITIANDASGVIAEQRQAALSELLAGPERDSTEQDIDGAIRDAREFVELVDDVVDEIELRFTGIVVGQFEGRAGDWPLSWHLRVSDKERAAFIAALRPFTGIAAAQHGDLLTPIVDGIRVAGPFQPGWWSSKNPLLLVLIDGEGVGHNPETLRSLPGPTTDRMASVDRVLLVDSAVQPMLEGPMLVARTVERLGQSSKLAICFTNLDRMRNAENLPRQRDKTEFVRDAARDVFRFLAREFGRPHLLDLDAAVEERSFFVSGIQAPLGDQARFTRDQLNQLADALRHQPVAAADHAIPEYDLDNLVIGTVAAAAEYVETYRALMKLPSQRVVRPAAWQTVKAATRYTSQFGSDGYGFLRPAADFAAMLGERLARFLSTPVAFEPRNCTDAAKEAATARVRQELAKRLDPWIRDRILARPLPLWVRAYAHRGTGSTRLRAFDIDVLNLAAVPQSSEEGDPEATKFRAEVKRLVIEAIESAGGVVIGAADARSAVA